MLERMDHLNCTLYAIDVGQQLRVDKVAILGDLTVEQALPREVSNGSK